MATIGRQHERRAEDGSTAAATCARAGAERPRSGRVGPALGGGEEALEVGQPISSVTARVDAVIPQSTGVAPGSDRVRVYPQQASGLGDGQCRVRRSGWKRRGHGSCSKKCEVDGARLPSSQFLPIVRRSRVVSPRVARPSGARRGASGTGPRGRSRERPAGRMRGRRRDRVLVRSFGGRHRPRASGSQPGPRPRRRG